MCLGFYCIFTEVLVYSGLGKKTLALLHRWSEKHCSRGGQINKPLWNLEVV